VEPKLAIVTWWDHTFAETGRAKPELYKSVGYIIEEEPSHYLLAMTIEGDGTVPLDENLESLCILRVAVHSVKEL
jgi:hypothetical protein